MSCAPNINRIFKNYPEAGDLLELVYPAWQNTLDGLVKRPDEIKYAMFLTPATELYRDKHVQIITARLLAIPARIEHLYLLNEFKRISSPFIRGKSEGDPPARSNNNKSRICLHQDKNRVQIRRRYFLAQVPPPPPAPGQDMTNQLKLPRPGDTLLIIPNSNKIIPPGRRQNNELCMITSPIKVVHSVKRLYIIYTQLLGPTQDGPSFSAGLKNLYTLCRPNNKQEFDPQLFVHSVMYPNHWLLHESSIATSYDTHSPDQLGSTGLNMLMDHLVWIQATDCIP